MNRNRRALAAVALLTLAGAATACTSSSPRATPSGSPVASSASPVTSSLDATAPPDSAPASSAPDSSSAPASTSPAASPNATTSPTASTSNAAPTTKPSPSSTTPVVFFTPYNNARYGFTSDVPSSFHAASPPEDGDGLSFTSGRATLAVFGSNNVNGDSAAKVQSELVATVAKANGTVTYKAISGSVAVVSATEPLTAGSTVVYTRVVVGPGSENTMRWSYPATEIRVYDPQVMHTIIDFHPGNVAIAH
jgi:hypothetical protein